MLPENFTEAFNEVVRALCLYRTPSRNDRILIMALSGAEGGGYSLRQLARLFELTPERVRQIVGAGEDRLMKAMVAGQATALRESLSNAVCILEACAPAAFLSLDTSVSVPPRRIPDRFFASPEMVIALADLCTVEHRLRITTWRDRSAGRIARARALVLLGTPEIDTAIVAVARRAARFIGAVHSQSIAIQFERERGFAVDERLVSAILRAFAKPLDDHGSEIGSGKWFSWPHLDTVLLERAKLLTSASNSCSLASLIADAIPAGHEAGLPNADLELVRLQLEAGGFSVTGDRVVRDQDIDERPSIKQRMLRIFHHLARQGTQEELEGTPGETCDAAVARQDFLEACAAAGINPVTARLYLYRSKLFRVDEGVCRLQL